MKHASRDNIKRKYKGREDKNKETQTLTNRNLQI